MKKFKLKLILTVLTSIIFSFIFILLAFVLPTNNYKKISEKKHNNILEEISESMGR